MYVLDPAMNLDGALDIQNSYYSPRLDLRTDIPHNEIELPGGNYKIADKRQSFSKWFSSLLKGAE